MLTMVILMTMKLCFSLKEPPLLEIFVCKWAAAGGQAKSEPLTFLRLSAQKPNLQEILDQIASKFPSGKRERLEPLEGPKLVRYR